MTKDFTMATVSVKLSGKEILVGIPRCMAVLLGKYLARRVLSVGYAVRLTTIMSHVRHSCYGRWWSARYGPVENIGQDGLYRLVVHLLEEFRKAGMLEPAIGSKSCFQRTIKGQDMFNRLLSNSSSEFFVQIVW